MWDIVWVSPQGHRSLSVSRHFLLQALQCSCSVRKRFSRDHCCRGRSKPGCQIVGLHTRWELTTWADFQLRSIPDRWQQAVPRRWWSHWEGMVAERRMSGGWYHQHGCVSRAQTALSVDVRCPEKAPSKVWRCCSMKTVVGQNVQSECYSLRSSQPM